MAQRQYSGNAHGLVMGISVVNCVYYNPETNQFWVIDYRVYNPDADVNYPPKFGPVNKVQIMVGKTDDDEDPEGVREGI
ncbi:MAG: hypothetical protein ACK53X_03190 [Holosporales bacterium]